MSATCARAWLCYHARRTPIIFMNRACSLVSCVHALRLRTLELAVLLVLAPLSMTAADRNPFTGDPKAAKAGEFEFRINCAFCHGLGARGGGRGPDLTHAQKRHGSSDTDLFQNISNGIAGTAMPANGTNGQGVGMTDEEICQIITYLRSIVEVKAPSQPIGNAVHGKQLFYGDANCSLCHMVEGKGGRVGRTLLALEVREPSKP
jgi:cbb3-type cytochrome c oxidase subunit III